MKRLLILFLLGSQISKAQVELDPVTVTASLQQARISATGRDITVIPGNAFQKLPVHSLDELLRYVPGIEIQQRGPQGSQSDIVMRGGTFQQVLVILDNVRINDPLTGHFNSYIPIAPAEIERIEIVRGAASALYGSDAVGGVIHIITKTFAARKAIHESALEASLTGGEYKLFNTSAGGFHSKGKWIVGGGVLSNNSEGALQRGTRGYFHNHTGSVSASYQMNDHWKLSARTAYDARDFAAQNFYTAFASDTANEQVDTWWNQVNLVHDNNGRRFNLDMGYKTVNDHYEFTKIAAPNDNRSSVFQSTASYGMKFKSSHIITGFQFIRRGIRSNDRGNHSVNNFAAFIVGQKQLGKSFFINPALRIEKRIIPQLSASLSSGRFLFRAAAGRAIRDPDFTERYNNYGKTLVTSGNIGSAILDAEDSWTIECGVDFYLDKKVKFSVTPFAKYYSNLIDWINTPYADMPRKENLSPAGNYFLSTNISKLTTSGVEIGFQFSDSNLTIQSGLSIINSSATTSLYISSHATFLFNYNLQYQFGKWLFSTAGVYKQRPAQKENASLASLSPDYFVMNGRVAFSVHPLSLFAQCDNILNRRYADRFGVPMPGRWWSLGVRVRINRLSSK